MFLVMNPKVVPMTNGMKFHVDEKYMKSNNDILGDVMVSRLYDNHIMKHYLVYTCSWLQSNPKESHLVIFKIILWYIISLNELVL